MYKGTKLAGAAGAHVPPLFTPTPKVWGMISSYHIGRVFGVKTCTHIPRNSLSRPVVHLHYLDQFGALDPVFSLVSVKIIMY